MTVPGRNILSDSRARERWNCRFDSCYDSYAGGRLSPLTGQVAERNSESHGLMPVRDKRMAVRADPW